MLGAFVAGVILRRTRRPSSDNRLMPKIEAIGFGFFIPLFFIISGANLDIDSIVENPGRLVLFFVLLLVVRGVPQYVLYRRALPDTRERWQFTLYVATGAARSSSRSPGSRSTPASCCRRTPPRWSAPARCRCSCSRCSATGSTAPHWHGSRRPARRTAMRPTT